MNTTRTPSAIDGDEWARQEQGLRAARLDAAGSFQGGHGHGTDARRIDDYRLVATAIATAPRSRPPLDFAAAVAAKAGSAAPDPGFEPTLAGGLLLLLGGAALVAAVSAVGPAWDALRQSVGAGSVGWMAVPGACIALGWALGQVRQLREHAPRAVAP
ncbi:hypothetical protein [Luteimonas sp. MC1750]|uniref:hypothetical protein n=1 Tax=Luteimonas sp. MC1750 TaxID=2799326 RepID=UPI0018F0BB25|nr:hypothetical protein [Luteimonas sp. MC1750]MBJ6985524.1 hypothetical protein [Luteimonas sp. MC1750]QQO05990.1 hypothetical protein JGR68_00560 [Luteimonas sp. MC1750]